MEKGKIREANPLALQQLFGPTAMAKLLDFLTLYHGLDYPKSEIAENSGIGWKTLHTLWPLLEHYELVKHTRDVGRAKLYRTNTDSPIIKALHQLAYQISTHNLEKQAKKRAPVPAIAKA